jgi:hypothetical protein
MMNKTLVIMTKMSVEHEFSFKILESASPDLNVMEWASPSPFMWMHCLAPPNGLALHLTQHGEQGLDHSKVQKSLNNYRELYTTNPSPTLTLLFLSPETSF